MSEQRYWAPSGALGPDAARQEQHAGFGLAIDGSGPRWRRFHEVLERTAATAGVAGEPRARVTFGATSHAERRGAFDAGVVLVELSDLGWARIGLEVACFAVDVDMNTEADARLVLELAGLVALRARREAGLRALSLAVPWSGTPYPTALSFQLALAGLAAHSALPELTGRLLAATGRWQRSLGRAPAAAVLDDPNAYTLENAVAMHRLAIARCVDDLKLGWAPEPKASAEPDDDAALIQRLQRKDRAAFEKLMQVYRSHLLRFFAVQGADSGEAEELTQEVFLYVWRNAPSFTFRSKVRPWLYSIARNLAIDAARKRSRDAKSATLPSAPLAAEAVAAEAIEDSPVQASSLRFLRDALQRLPDEMRDVVVLRVMNDLTYPEIAKVLGVPVNTVSKRAHRAMEKLRNDLERAEGEGLDLAVKKLGSD